MIFTNLILGCWDFDFFENCKNPYPLPAPSPAYLSGLTLMSTLHRDTPAHRYTVFLNAMCDALSMKSSGFTIWLKTGNMRKYLSDHNVIISTGTLLHPCKTF